jgi:hypothetical protein
MEQLNLPLLIAISVIALACVIAGCDSKRELVVIAPDVSGTLTVRGEPAEGAEVLIGFRESRSPLCRRTGSCRGGCGWAFLVAGEDIADERSGVSKRPRWNISELRLLPFQGRTDRRFFVAYQVG